MDTVPPDLFRLIFSNQLPQGSQLSQRNRSILSSTAFQTLCSLPISQTEINNYLQKFPRNIALFYTSYDVTYFDLYRLNGIYPTYTPSDNIFNRIQFYCTFNEIYSTDSYGNDLFSPAYQFIFPDETPETDNWTVFPHNISDATFDILSQYYIFNNRLGCISVNPSYVKDHLLELFDQTIDRYSSSSNPIYLLDLYCYLIGHTWIFNILYPVPQEEIFILIDEQKFPLEGEMEKPVIMQVKRDIAQLIEIIKRKIAQLD